MFASSKNVFTINPWLASLALLLALGLQAIPARAIDWINTTNSNSYYDIGANWSGGVAPLPTDNADFQVAATYEVWWDGTIGNPTSDMLTVNAGEVTFRQFGIGGPFTHNVTGDAQIDSGSLTLGVSGNPLNLSVGNVLSVSNGGELNVLFDSDVTATTLEVGKSPGASPALMTVDGAGSTFLQTGASTLDIGSASGSTGTLNVQNSGTFTTGTGVTTVNATGTINHSGGAFYANGDMTLDGGSYLRTDGVITFAAGTTLTVQNGGLFEWGGTNGFLFLNDVGSSVLVTGTGSTFRQTDSAGDDGTLFVQNGVAMDATLGGTIEAEYLFVENGSVTIDGAGSTLDVTAGNAAEYVHQVGNGTSANGSLTLSNDATGSFDSTLATTLHVGSNGSTGTIDVLTGADLTLQSLDMDETGTSTVTVNGSGSSILQTGASTLDIGSASGSTGTLNVQNGGTFTTGTGTTTVNATGTLNIDVVGDGTFNANGNVNVDGGTITGGSGISSFNLASGLTLTAMNDAQVDFGGIYSIDQGTTFDIQSGADFSTTGWLDIGTSFGDGTLVVDGAGSSVTADTDTSLWGLTGNTADVTFRNGATGNLDSINLARSTVGGTTGIFNVESGATVTTGNLSIAEFGGATTSGTITVDGVTSSLTQNGTSTLAVGHSSTGTATINVQNGGTFTTGTGTTTVNATGTINVGVVGNGTFNANGNVNVNGGTITRGGGSSSFNLASGLTLTATNNAQINFGDDYSIDQGTTFDIQSGADFSTTNYLGIGDTGGGDGTLLVDGVGSSVTTGTGNFNWGRAGNTADVTFRNGATGNLGSIQLARSLAGGTTGIFNIESGAAVTTGFLNIATFGGATTSGTITVDGVTSSLTQNGGSSLLVGHSSTGTATINVQNGGTFNTGTGAITVQSTGTINHTGGTFNVNGNMTINGGSYLRTAGNLNIASGTTLTVQDSGLFEWGGANGFLFLKSSVLVTGTGSTFRQTDSAGSDGILYVQNGVAMDATLGGTIEAEYLRVENGSVTIDGAGSTLDVTAGNTASFIHRIGSDSSSNSSLTLSNDATGSFASATPTILHVGSGVGATGTIDVLTGADLTLQSLDMDETGTSTVTVNGVGSTIVQTSASTLRVGSSSGSTGTLNVQNDGTFTTGTGATTVNATGTINHTGGTFNANGNMTIDGGSYLRTAGDLNIAASTTLTVQNGGLFEWDGTDDSLFLNDVGSSVLVTGTGSILRQTDSLLIDGALFVENGVAMDATLGGTIEAEYLFVKNGSVTIDGVGSTLDVTAGNTSTFIHRVGSGSSTNGSLTISNDATGSFASAFPTTLHVGNGVGSTGTINVLTGADLTLQSIDMDESGTSTVTVHGAGSSILQVGASTLEVGSDSGSTGRIHIQNNGTFTTGTGAITVNATGAIHLDDGTLVANSAVNLDGGTLRGSGSVELGTVNVNAGGTVAPGTSPGTLTVEDIVFNTDSVLNIEIGGLMADSQYDVLAVGDSATLAGTLDIDLFDLETGAGLFSPSLGDSFQILTANSVAGMFDSILGTNLGGGLFFDVIYGSSNVTLNVISNGDFDVDGDIDGADFLTWQRGFGSAYDADDLVRWETNFGTPAVLAAASTTVPEPASALMLLLGMLTVLADRRKARSKPNTV